VAPKKTAYVSYAAKVETNSRGLLLKFSKKINSSHEVLTSLFRNKKSHFTVTLAIIYPYNLDGQRDS